MLGPGSWVGSYQIEAHIGSGGMGDVYRARDTRLGRIVALKLLREPIASHGEDLDRFAREAQLLASLHHPHIASIFAFEESDGVRAIVQEFVDGPTLSERLQRGPIGVHEAVAVARQIADALDAAHQRGIIHRDLKPANVKITADGNVKLLDFGLAKALSDDADDQTAGSVTLAATHARTLLGTPAYMSPEQAVGAQVDRRADIWAFGCVLFKMIVGRPAFEGSTSSSVLASALHDEPSWDALPRETPPALKRLLRRCLQKDPRRRLRDIGDAFVELDDDISLTATLPARRHKLTPVWAGAGALAGGLAVWMLAGQAPLPTPGPGLHASLVLDKLGLPLSTAGHVFALAPDGRHLAYIAADDKPNRIWLRALDDFTARPLEGTERAVNPFFSADSLWVGFFADQQVKKIALAGGAPIPVLDHEGPPRGAVWAADGAIIVGGPKLLRVPTECWSARGDSRII